MRGVRHLRPACSPAIPTWDLSVILEALMETPYEPLESAPEWILTLSRAAFPPQELSTGTRNFGVVLGVFTP